MESQYYFPTIDEFHSGFEYQIKNADWDNKIVVLDTMLDAIEYHLKSGVIRVKSLDRQDIEECGWTQRDHDTYDIEGYALEFDSEYKTFIYHTGPRHGTVFKGTIRNKSELVKLMQMLNIK